MITCDLCTIGGCACPSKVIKFADRNFDQLKLRPMIILLQHDLSVILHHPSFDKTELNVWMFQKCIIPQLELLRYACVIMIKLKRNFFIAFFFDNLLDRRLFKMIMMVLQLLRCHALNYKCGEEEYSRVLMGECHLDNCPELKTGVIVSARSVWFLVIQFTHLVRD